MTQYNLLHLYRREPVMTRINVIQPYQLLDEHLLAETRELPRIPNELIKHPKHLVLADIPPVFTLNHGHVKFFRNKLLWLVNRHKVLKAECDLRGIKNDLWSIDERLFNPVMNMFAMNDYSVTDDAILINVERITERFCLRKSAYHYKGEKIDTDHEFNRYLENVGLK